MFILGIENGKIYQLKMVGNNEKMQEGKLLKSISINVILKPVSVILSYLYAPLLLNYLGEEKYGIWATILSIISWFSYFDIGIGNGLRNLLSAKIAKNDYEGCKKSVSTAYALLLRIMMAIGGVAIIIFAILDWKMILNSKIDAKIPIIISAAFICINLILSLYQAQCYSLQRAEWVAINGVCVQILNLLGVWLLSHTDISSLNAMAILFGLSTFIVNSFFTIGIWKSHPYFIPKFSLCDKKENHAILNVGVQFLFIQLSALILFTTDSIIISRLYGPELVTPYNIVNKVFLLFSTTFSAITAPIWSRCTLAFESGNVEWIRKAVNKLCLLLLPIGAIMFGVAFYFQTISDIWLHYELVYENGLVWMMALYIWLTLYANIYSTVMNGTGQLKIQIFVAIVSAVIHIPIAVFLAKYMNWGTTGICLSSILTTFVGNVIFTKCVSTFLKEKKA